MRIFLFTITVLSLFFQCSFQLFAQKQNNIWYFGQKAGLDFNYSSPQYILNPPTPAYSEKPSLIADHNGNLLAYLDGNRVYNKQNQLMVNGDSLNGASFYNLSSLIIPSPSDDSVLYLFTLPLIENKFQLSYAIAEVSAANTQGKVVSKQHVLFTNSTGKLAGIRHCNGRDYWILTAEANTNRFFAYLLSSAGICNAPVVSIAGQKQDYQTGDMKFSPDGKMLVTVADGHDSQIFHFNAHTGQVSFNFLIPKDLFGPQPNYTSAYHSASFSPDNTKLYLSSGFWRALDGRCAKLVQYDLLAADIAASGHILYDNTIPGLSGNNSPQCRTWGVGDIQIGPDGKIYVSNYGRDSLHIVEKPNLKGEQANFILNGIGLGTGSCNWRLPNFIESYFNASTGNLTCLPDTGKISFSYQNTCYTQLTSFKIHSNDKGPFSVLWDFGDSLSATNSSNELNPTHIFSTPGNYSVSLTLISLFDCSIKNSIKETITILPAIPVELGSDITLCEGQDIILDATTTGAKGYLWSNGTREPTLRVNQAGGYSVAVDQGECIIKDSINVWITPPITNSLGNDTALCAGEVLYLDVTSPGASYRWNNGSTDNAIFVNSAGIYEVVINNTCATKKLAIRVDFKDCNLSPGGPLTCESMNSRIIANVFTPNGDGINDLFGMEGWESVKGFSMEIYNRWGQRVFTSNGTHKQWNGEGAATGIYFYLISFTCSQNKQVVNRSLKGYVTLLK